MTDLRDQWLTEYTRIREELCIATRLFSHTLNAEEVAKLEAFFAVTDGASPQQVGDPEETTHE